jgi:hypothetical protein
VTTSGSCGGARGEGARPSRVRRVLGGARTVAQHTDSAHEMSVHYGPDNGATHAIPARPLALRARPGSLRGALRRRAQPSRGASGGRTRTAESVPRNDLSDDAQPGGLAHERRVRKPGTVESSTRRARSVAGCWASSASAGGCASERDGEERLRDLGDGRDEEGKEEEPRVVPSSPRHFRGENTAICESGQCACLVIALPCPCVIQILGRRRRSDDVRAQRVPKCCFIPARARPRPDVGAQFTFLSHDTYWL